MEPTRVGVVGQVQCKGSAARLEPVFGAKLGGT
jgi:hypothetical protein